MDLALLVGNEAALATALLPDDPDLTAALGQDEQFLTHAYLVLACAVIEEFIEDCFESYVGNAMQTSGEHVAPCFVSLAAKFSGDLVGQTNTIPSASSACPILRGLYASKIVRPNNGVKRQNLKALAKPLGLLQELEDKCDDLLGPSDALGARRGAVAHIGAVTEELRPGDARQLVSDVLQHLPLLVSMLNLA